MERVAREMGLRRGEEAAGLVAVELREASLELRSQGIRGTPAVFVQRLLRGRHQRRVTRKAEVVRAGEVQDPALDADEVHLRPLLGPQDVRRPAESATWKSTESELLTRTPSIHKKTTCSNITSLKFGPWL